MYNNETATVKKENTSTTSTTTSSTSNDINSTVYPIYLSNTSKQWNIAKFTSKVDFTDFVKPVKMYKNSNKPEADGAANGGTTSADGNKAGGGLVKSETIGTSSNTSTTSTSAPAIVAPARTKKRIEAKPVNPKTIPWRLEDSEGNHAFQGMIEGNQSSSYFLFMFTSNNTITAVPCTDWYTFRLRKDIEAYTTEEAEEIMSKNARDRDAVVARISKKGATAGESGDGAGGSGAGGDKKDEDKEYRQEMYEDEDRFKEYQTGNGASEEKKRQQQQQQRRRNRSHDEDGGGEDEDAPDFEGRFDDDDDAYEDNDLMTEDGPQLGDEEDEEDSNRGLTATGLEMKKLLNMKTKQEESEDDDDSTPGDDDDDDDDEDPDDDDFTLTKAQLMGRYPGRGTIQDGSNKDKSPIQSPQTSTPPSPSQPTTSTTSTTISTPAAKKSAKKAAAGAVTTPTSKKIGSPPGENKATGKRKETSSPASPTTTTSTTGGAAIKKVKQEPTSPSNSPPNSPPSSASVAGEELTEEAMRRVLVERRKIKTIDFIQIFKQHLKTPEAKKLFSSLLHRLAHVVDDGGHKYLIPNGK